MFFIELKNSRKTGKKDKMLLVSFMERHKHTTNEPSFELRLIIIGTMCTVCGFL